MKALGRVGVEMKALGRVGVEMKALGRQTRPVMGLLPTRHLIRHRLTMALGLIL